MAIRKWMVVASLALVAVVALTVASIGSAKPAAPAKFRVALVTDIGGLNDKGFNALAYKGLKQAQAKFGVDGRVFISKSAADYIPNLSTGATQGYDMVIAVGFLMSDSTAAVAKRFPNTKFAIVDVSAPFMKGKPKNVRGIVFAEQEAGCLAGVASARTSEDERDRLGRRSQDPARRRVHRGVPVLREEAQAEHHHAERLLAGLRRPGQVQGSRAQPARRER